MMTIEEATNEIVKLIEYHALDMDEPLNMAVSALEKQISKKPIITNFGNGAKQITCNTCSMCLHITSLIKYCPYCGQKIDWTEDEK